MFSPRLRFFSKLQSSPIYPAAAQPHSISDQSSRACLNEVTQRFTFASRSVNKSKLIPHSFSLASHISRTTTSSPIYTRATMMPVSSRSTRTPPSSLTEFAVSATTATLWPLLSSNIRCLVLITVPPLLGREWLLQSFYRRIPHDSTLRTPQSAPPSPAPRSRGQFHSLSGLRQS